MSAREQLIAAAEQLNLLQLVQTDHNSDLPLDLLQAAAAIYGAAESYTVRYATMALAHGTDDPVGAVDYAANRARNAVGPQS